MGYRKTGVALMALAGVMGAVALPPVVAEAQSSRLGSRESGTVYTAIEPSLIVDIMEEAGFETEVEEVDLDDGARRYIVIGNMDGFVVAATVRVCDVDDHPRGCLGVNFLAMWEIGRGKLRDVNNSVDAFSQQTVYGRLFVNREGTQLNYSHYMIMDYGVTRDNIAANLDLFISMCGIIVDEYMDGMLVLDDDDGGRRRGK